MEVTRRNFKETLPLVADSIEKADFLVIDAEFTGLIHGKDVSVFDSPEEYYKTVSNGSSEFLLIQFGLCAFYWHDEEQHYMNDAYNFYLFPRGRPGPERMFLCQSSSLDFLASQGFDFNKLIKEGISYMSEPVESRMREHLIERQKSYNNDMQTITIPEEHKQQIGDICNRVRKFLDENKSDEMEIDRCNAFIRRLLFQELGAKFKAEAFVETKILENKDRVLKVTRITSENDRKSKDIKKNEKEWEELEDAVGFSKVARMISQSEKLVVGHNMLLDLLHTLNHFFQPLPLDYGTFKEFAHCMFPKVLDTKYMSSLPPFKEKVNSNVLQHLLATLSEPPFSLPKADSEEGRGYNTTDEKHHEAGYDAYVTGLCFLAMHAHLSRMRGEPLGRAASHSAALKPFLNKVFLAKTAYQDSPYMNLIGDDPSPSRDHVFHLTFPREWTRNDINQLFSPFGQICVQFLDDTSALVALGRRDLAKQVQRVLEDHSKIKIQPYSRYKNNISVHKETENVQLLPNLNTPETTSKNRQVTPAFGSKQKLPEKVERPRSNSMSSAASAQPAANPTTRKRTSSGMFQIDDAEPPPKKTEISRSETDRKKADATSNGFRKTSESEKGDSRKGKAIEKSHKASESEREKRLKKEEDNSSKKVKVVEKFDAEAKSNCVTAFKESDSWD